MPEGISDEEFEKFDDWYKTHHNLAEALALIEGASNITSAGKEWITRAIKIGAFKRFQANKGYDCLPLPDYMHFISRGLIDALIRDRTAPFRTPDGEWDMAKVANYLDRRSRRQGK